MSRTPDVWCSSRAGRELVGRELYSGGIFPSRISSSYLGTHEYTITLTLENNNAVNQSKSTQSAPSTHHPPQHPASHPPQHSRYPLRYRSSSEPQWPSATIALSVRASLLRAWWSQLETVEQWQRCLIDTEMAAPLAVWNTCLWSGTKVVVPSAYVNLPSRPLSPPVPVHNKSGEALEQRELGIN